MITRFLRRHYRVLQNGRIRITMLIISILSLFVAAFWDSFFGLEISMLLLYSLSCVTAALAYGYIAGFINSIISVALIFVIRFMHEGAFSLAFVLNSLQVFIVLNLLGYLTHESAMASGNRKDSTIDHLTGALKGRFFREILHRETERAYESGKCFSFLLFDFDDFSRVNNEHGRQEGDELLRTTGKIVCANIRPHDVFTRLEDDKFALLLPATAHRDADLQTDIVLQILENIISIKKWPVAISSVLLTVKDRKIYATEILKMVDDELFSVKTSARGTKKRLSI